MDVALVAMQIAFLALALSLLAYSQVNLIRGRRALTPEEFKLWMDSMDKRSAMIAEQVKRNDAAIASVKEAALARASLHV